MSVLYNAKNLTVSLDGGTMEVIRFGRGSRTLVMLPGLGTSIQSFKGMALPMAVMYRMFAGDFTVYFLGTRKPVKPDCSTRDMARDVRDALEQLQIPKADVVGVSMGGMIAQHLASSWPEKVNRLVLAVTSPGPNALMEEALGQWESFARKEDHRGFMDSNVRRIYSEEYYRRNRFLIPITGALTKPKSYEPFFLQSRACRTHDARGLLEKITAPTLVIGGEKDRVLGGDASRELAAGIAGARLHMYAQWGHGAYEEAKDFNALVLDFLME